MEQVKALHALEPFLALSKSATSPRAAAQLVQQATSAPNTFIFAELLNQPQIQTLSSSSEFGPALTILQIFSYGTYATYAETAGLPPLNEAQSLKLRQLSLLTLAGDKAALGYSALMHSLGLATTRELENIVVSAVYAGLIEAKLDPARQYVRVSSVAPLRDLAPGAVPNLIASLRRWSARCDAGLADLEAEIVSIRETASRKAAAQHEWDVRVNHLMEEERLGELGPLKKLGAMSGRGRRLGFGKRGSTLMESATDDLDDEAMDVDDDDDGDMKKRASRRKL